MKKLLNNFKIKTTELNILEKESLESPMEEQQKPENLRFTPLDIPTLNSQTSKSLDQIENTLYGITSGKNPKKEAKEKPMQKMKLPYIPKTKIFNL